MPANNRLALVVLAYSAFLFFTGIANAAVSIEVPKHVQAEKETRVRIQAGDETLSLGSLRVTYRPGSVVEVTEQMPVPSLQKGSVHTLTWVPKHPGIIRLDYKARPRIGGELKDAVSTSTLVGATFTTTPVSGVVVMTLAGLILFGGCWFAFRLLTTNDDDESGPA